MKQYLDQFKKLSITARLSLFVGALLLVTIGITVNNSLNRQDNRTRAASNSLSKNNESLVKSSYIAQAYVTPTIYCLGSCPTSIPTPTPNISAVPTPNSNCPATPLNNTINWSGYTWSVRSGSGGPGPNNWSNSANNVWVDSQCNLHLKITNLNGTWYASEVYVSKSFGPGTYTTKMVTNPLSPAYDNYTVAGIFYYLNDQNELDIEYSRWGSSAQNNLGQFTVQGTSPIAASTPFYINASNTTNKWVWSPDGKVSFETRDSSSNIINSWNYTGTYKTASNGVFDLNFWLVDGNPPSDGLEKELVFSGFSYTPYSSTTLAPTQSLTLTPTTSIPISNPSPTQPTVLTPTIPVSQTPSASPSSTIIPCVTLAPAQVNANAAANRRRMQGRRNGGGISGWFQQLIEFLRWLIEQLLQRLGIGGIPTPTPTPIAEPTLPIIPTQSIQPTQPGQPTQSITPQPSQPVAPTLPVCPTNTPANPSPTTIVQPTITPTPISAPTLGSQTPTPTIISNSACPGAPATKTISGQQYSIKWCDEFNGTSLDTSKWQFFNGYGSQSDLKFSNSSVLMVASKAGNYVSVPFLQTKSLFTYGYFEIRMRQSNTSNVDNELWLAEGQGYNSGGNEIDILERPYYGSNDGRPWCINSIWAPGLDWASSHNNGDYNCGFTADSQYHTYGLLWDSSQIVYYVDGTESWRAPSGYPSVMNKPMSYIMELCADNNPDGCNYQGMGAGGVSLSDLPTDMGVDYVRVYQK